MRKLLFALLVLLAINAEAATYFYNAFTTNPPATTTNVVLSIAGVGGTLWGTNTDGTITNNSNLGISVAAGQKYYFGGALGAYLNASAGTLSSSGPFTSSGLLTAANGITVTAGTVTGNGGGLTNLLGIYTNKLLSPPGGNDGIADMLNGTADFAGQVGLAWYGTKSPFLWFAAQSGSGSNAWRVTPSFPSGIGLIGHPTNMPRSQFNGVRIYQNGNPIDACINESTNANGSYLYHINMAYGSDGNAIAFPMLTTNPASFGGIGNAVLTASNGVPIGYRDPWGLVVGSFPFESSPGQGPANLAGSYALLAGDGGDVPLQFALNYRMTGETQPTPTHSWQFMEQNNALTHFPWWTANAFNPTNTAWRDVAVIHNLDGYMQINSNVFCGAIRATNEQSFSLFGPNFNDNGFSGFMVTTNMDWAPHNAPAYFTWDYQGSGRIGPVIIFGQYPKIGITPGTPFIVTAASGGNLKVNTGTQTYVDKLHISTAEVTLAESSATVVFNVSIAAGKSCGGTVHATTRADDATNFQVVHDVLSFAAENKAGTVIANISSSSPTATAVSSGTLTTTWTVAPNGNSVDIKNNAVSSLTQTTLKTTWRLELDSSDAASAVTPN